MIALLTLHVQESAIAASLFSDDLWLRELFDLATGGECNFGFD